MNQEINQLIDQFHMIDVAIVCYMILIACSAIIAVEIIKAKVKRW